MILLALAAIAATMSLTRAADIPGSSINLQTCIENFDVHRDKIIRTQDSKEMGAKYLNEFDLGSREECLRLCCETASCDVFVYEEKSPGSCYLFHCGPPEDFRCKFTRHANYSSAVLSVNRQLSELETQIKQSKHEHELSKLRAPSVAVPPLVNSPTIAPTKAPTTAKLKAAPQIVTPTKSFAVQSASKCSPYQFECRESHDCIAIYNVCDGIPQCSDGSDEASELRCPTAAPTRVQSQQPPPPAMPINVEYHDPVQGPMLRKALPPIEDDSMYRNRISQDDSPNRMVPSHRFMPQSAPDHPQIMQEFGRQMIPQQEFGVPPQSSEVWQGRQLVQGMAPNEYEQAPVKTGHIFNHKETGLQVDSQSNPVGLPYVASGNRNQYSKMYEDIYRKPQMGAENWQAAQNLPGNVPYAGENRNPAEWQQQVPQQQNLDQMVRLEELNQQIQKQAGVAAPASKVETQYAKTKPEESHAVASEDRTTGTRKLIHAVNKTTARHEKSKQRMHYASAEFSELRFDEAYELIDGETGRPGGAILSLILGITISGVLAVIIGCRLRVVRRRIRRGGKSPYAHDADFLVNGMYL